MSAKLDEVMKDVEELRTLVASATRKRVQDMLAQELRKVEIEVTQLQEVLVAAAVAQAAEQKPKVSTTPSTFTINLRNYSWDQSEKFIKLYINLKNVHTLAKEAVTTSYGKNTMELHVSELEGKNYNLSINNLAGSVNPDASYHKVKTDMLVLLLAKVDQGQKWTGVTAEDVKTNEARKPKMNSEDPSGGIMDLMKQMYQDGDDKMKQMLNKTWYESQQKTMKGEGPGTGMPGMPGMEGMPGMPGMEGMPGMGGMPGMPDMSDLGL